MPLAARRRGGAGIMRAPRLHGCVAMSLRFGFSLLLLGGLLPGLLTAAPAPAADAPAAAPPALAERSFMIAVSPGGCTLEEAGRLARPDQPDPAKLQLQGTLTEEDPGVFRCTVGVAAPLLPAAPYACRLTGFAQSDLVLFKGDPRYVRRACWVRRLGSGALEFNATGIASDVCAFSCAGP